MAGAVADPLPPPWAQGRTGHEPEADPPALTVLGAGDPAWALAMVNLLDLQAHWATPKGPPP